MQGDVLVARTRESVKQLLGAIEAVQGDAAALVQRWNKLGGSAAVADLALEDWTALGLTETQFTDAMSSLGTLFPDLLGAHGTNLYTIVQ